MRAPVRWDRWNRYLLLAASFHFALVYTLNTSPFLNLHAFAAGSERAPFQYRALTAWLFWLVEALPALPKQVKHHLPLNLVRSGSLFVLPLAFASLLLATHATRRALELLTGDLVASRWWALLVIWMCYFHYLLDFGHPCCTPFQLPYDLPSVAFFAVCLYLLIARRIGLFYVWFAFATLNHESSIFLLGIFLLYRSVGIRNVRSPGLWQLLTQIVSLSAIWIALRFTLLHMYSPLPVPGRHIGTFELHLFDNAGYLMKPYYWGSYASIFGFAWLFLYTHWMEIPYPGIRRALWIGPVCFVCLYAVGVFSEIRIFGELISLHVIALVCLLRKLLQLNSTQAPPRPAWEHSPRAADLP